MKIVVEKKKVMVDGIQSGKTYASQKNAIIQAKQLKEKHYQHAELVIIEEYE